MGAEARRLSVILAAWNGADYLAEAIDSVLGQTVPPLELIVVDDGSTDRTPSILAGYGTAIRAIRQVNSGQSAAICAGLALATGSFLAFQDADDLWTRRKSELQFAAFADDPSLDAVFGYSEQFVSPEIEGAERLRLTPPSPLLAGEISTCMTIRRSSFDRTGPFDGTLSTAFFIDWLARAKSAGLKSRMLDDVVHRRRLHLGNNGRVNPKLRDRQLLGALRRHIVAQKRDA